MPPRKFSFLPCLALAAFSSAYSQPELSTGPGQSLEYNQQRDALVARGDAMLRDGALLIRADEISLFQRDRRAEAEGRVEITRDGLRILAESAAYDIPTRTFQAHSFRAGSWPLFFEGESARADTSGLLLEDAVVHFGEPAPWNLSLHANQLRYTEDGRIRAERARLRIGSFPLLTMPRFSGNLESPPVRYRGRLGYRSRLGGYLQNEGLLQLHEQFYAGANFDLYSRRGVLIGPSMRYGSTDPDGSFEGSLSAGWINDGGPRGVDAAGRPIDRNRHFLRASHFQQNRNGDQLRAEVHWWSDGEVLRDFREDPFYRQQNPDNFVEGTFHADPLIVTVLTRFRANEFQFVRERLPEIRIDLPPAPIGDFGLWHRGFLRFASIRERDLLEFNGTRLRGDGDDDRSNRLDLHYGWIRPLQLRPGIRWAPRASLRASHYFESNTPGRDSYSRLLGEIGFDFEVDAHATWDLNNPLWKINGLRHQVRNRIQYRYLPHASAGVGSIPAVDTPVFSINRQPINLMDERSMDRLLDRHLIRIGSENHWQTRHPEFGSRELVSLKVYQDLLLNPGNGAHTLDSLWTELEFHPAPWLHGALFTRWDSHERELGDLRARIGIQDADRWAIHIGADYLENRFEQYLIEASRRITDRWQAEVILRWDRKQDRLTDQVYALSQQIGRTFALRYALRLRSGSEREENLQFNVSLSFLGL